MSWVLEFKRFLTSHKLSFIHLTLATWIKRDDLFSNRNKKVVWKLEIETLKNSGWWIHFFRKQSLFFSMWKWKHVFLKLFLKFKETTLNLMISFLANLEDKFKKNVIICLLYPILILCICKKHVKLHYQLFVKKDVVFMKLMVHLRIGSLRSLRWSCVLIQVRTIFHSVFPVHAHWYDL